MPAPKWATRSRTAVAPHAGRLLLGIDRAVLYTYVHYPLAVHASRWLLPKAQTASLRSMLTGFCAMPTSRRTVFSLLRIASAHQNYGISLATYGPPGE